MFYSLCARLKAQIQNMSSWVHCKIQPETFVQPKGISEEVLKDEASIDHATSSLYSLHLSISLLFFLITDFVNGQDIDLVKGLLSNNKDTEEKSAFEEVVTFKDVEELKKDALLQPNSQSEVPLITMENLDKLKLVQQSFDCIIMFFKQLSTVEF